MIVIVPKEESGSESMFATLVILNMPAKLEYGIDFSDVCKV